MTDKLREAAQQALEALKETSVECAIEILEAALAQQDAQAVPGMGRKLYGELIAAIRNLIDAQDEPARWGCVGPTEADLAWDRVTQLANYICLGLDSPPTAPTPPAQKGAKAMPLTEKQRVYFAQAWAMLEDYAIDQRQAGNDSIADGANASAHEIKLMLNAAPTPPAQQEWIDDAGRLQWALWRIKDLEQQLAGRPVAITPPARATLTASEILNMTPESIPAEHDGALLEYARAIIEAYERKNGKDAP